MGPGLSDVLAGGVADASRERLDAEVGVSGGGSDQKSEKEDRCAAG
jgi:hypothetical protein